VTCLVCGEYGHKARHCPPEVYTRDGAQYASPRYMFENGKFDKWGGKAC